MPASRSRIARNAVFTSRVKIEDDSPYLIPFETRIASSASRTLMSAVTGPKISSCAMRICGVDVGEDGRPVEEAPAEVALGRDFAAGEELRAFVRADLRVRVDLLERRLVDHGPDVGARLPTRVPSRSFSTAVDELLLERVVHLLVRDDARRGRAALAGRAERRPHDAVDREVEVGVVQDDDRVLAAELEVHVLERLRARLQHLDAGLARAGERDDANVGMAHHAVADGRSRRRARC